MDASFIQGRITATKALIIVYEDALLFLGNNPTMSYTIDTGQSKQTATKFDISSINNIVASLYNRCATLEARLNGSGNGIGRPCW